MGSRRDRREKKALEVLNFMNLLNHYGDQLRLILDGVSACEVLDPRERKKLLGEGILIVNRAHSLNKEHNVFWAVETLLGRLKE